MSPIFRNNQAAVVYKNHTINCQLSLAPDRKNLVPMATISWKTNGKLSVYFFRSNKECSTGENANEVALEEAKLWVDAKQG